MKIVLITLLLSLTVGSMHSQSLVGAWEHTQKLDNGQEVRSVLIVTDGYQVLSTYDAKNGEFLQTNGGSWSLDGTTMTETVEFHTTNPDMVGQTVSFEIELSKDTLQVVGSKDVFTRIDDGTPGKLAGAWLMSGRVRDGQIQTRDTNRPRKTMKILSGTRFQWIAYNTETKQFMATGGGTYTTENGTYTENIEFFSRDASRVGMSLDFQFEIQDGDWVHKGKSSKGNPIHEIWSLRR